MPARRRVDADGAGAAGRPARADRPGSAAADGARHWSLVLAVVVALFAAAAAHKDYRVQPGDTLEAIAQRHGTSVRALAAANDLPDPDRIVAGSLVRIPDGGASTHHVVQAGESLSVIAARYGVAVADLVAWNGLAGPDRVWAGQRLSVGGPAATNVADAGGGGSHEVAAGETLSQIAARHGVAVSDLARSNAIADTNRIRAGTSLTVPGGWHCPVRGAVRFVNDFGLLTASGRFHEGVDLFAARGTPVVAPVAGRVEHMRGARAGLQFRLRGVDGHTYIGTHLDRFGAAGQVPAGAVLGTVGSTGNARGTAPHLHFEIHLDGSQRTNPYPSLQAACR